MQRWYVIKRLLQNRIKKEQEFHCKNEEKICLYCDTKVESEGVTITQETNNVLKRGSKPRFFFAPLNFAFFCPFLLSVAHSSTTTRTAPNWSI